MASEFLWAVHAGLVLAAPVSLVVGTSFALSTTASAFHRTIPKIAGWLAGLPFAVGTGALIAPLLVPSFWPKVGAFYCAGFGWALVWTVIAVAARQDPEDPESPYGRPPTRKQPEKKRRIQLPQSPLKLRTLRPEEDR